MDDLTPYSMEGVDHGSLEDDHGLPTSFMLLSGRRVKERNAQVERADDIGGSRCPNFSQEQGSN